MFLGWDALLFPRKIDYFVFTSHDEFVCVIAKEKEVYSELWSSSVFSSQRKALGIFGSES